MHLLLRNALVLLVVSFLIISCSVIGPAKGEIGTCRTLQSDIIFSGATSNDRQFTIENVELGLQQRMYDKDCMKQKEG